jgi:uncharacterized integral membrane protein
MDTTSIALAALTIAVIALIRTRRRQRGWPDPRRPLDVPGNPALRATAVLTLARVPARDARATATDRFLRVAPGVFAVGGVTMMIAAFAWQNTQAVSVRFLDWHVDGLPLAAALLGSGLGTGAAVAALALLERRALMARIGRLEQCLRQAAGARPRAHRYVGLRRTSSGESRPYRRS